ncbi:hypothetical protein J3B02_005518, partial [Coemansia erecta]
MGGALLQKLNRDTMSMAIKLSSITYSDGSTRDIMKFPRAGSSKVSLPGEFAVCADPEQAGVPVAFRTKDAPPASENQLKVVYDHGPIAGLTWDCFDNVRRRLNDQWSRFPRHANAVSSSLLAHQQAVHKAQAKHVYEGPNTVLADAALNDQHLFESTALNDAIDDALNTYVSSESRPRRQAPSKVDFARPAIHAYDTLNQYATSGQWRALALASESSILATPSIEASAILKRW